MRCAWDQLLKVLPPRFRREVDSLGRDTMQELRLRKGSPPQLVTAQGSHWLRERVTDEDLSFCVQTASRYSPWNAATIRQGYLTAPGGHRIGLCGQTVMKEGRMEGIRQPTSLCIRVARDFDGIAAGLQDISGSVLILGPPGWGKTTLLRALIRTLSDRGQTIAVVDERMELFPPGSGFEPGRSTDILTGCPKSQGIPAVLRTMGPSAIAVDEITAEEDTQALLTAAYCGVRLLATAHGSTLDDVRHRPVYRPLAEQGIFTNYVIMNRDKSWHMERMNL